MRTMWGRNEFEGNTMEKDMYTYMYNIYGFDSVYICMISDVCMYLYMAN